MKKAVVIIMAIMVVAVVAVIGVGCNNGWNLLPDKDNNNSTSAKNEIGGAILSGNESFGISLMSAPIPVAAYAENGIDSQADSAYTLTATIEPSEATNKKVDWSVAFANSSSSWASGKTATEYVTVSPTADGALTATVTCNQAFGEKIIVSVVSRDNPEKKATCSVDYLKRITSVSSSVSVGSAGEIVVGKKTNYSVTVNYGVGTITGSCTYSSTLHFSDAFRNIVHSNQYFTMACAATGTTPASGRVYLYPSRELSILNATSGFTIADTQCLFGGQGANETFYNYANTAFCQSVESCLDSGSSYSFGDVTTTVTYTYGGITETKTTTVDVTKIDISSLSVSVSNVALASTTMLF